MLDTLPIPIPADRRGGMDSAPLWYWINERHAIYLRKQRGEAHLTDDAILATYRFCNVFRELDTVTVSIRENIREPYADHPNLWLMLAIARYINWPPTLAQLLGTAAWPTASDWCPEHLSKAWVAIAKRGGKVETGAYMIRAESDKSKPWYHWPKQRYLAEVVIGRLWKWERQWRQFLEAGGSLRAAWIKLSAEYGWGPFMAYEVVTDLRHTRYLSSAPDIMTWANAGPGALRGLNRLMDRDIKAPVRDPVGLMRQLLAEQDQHRAEWVPRLEMRDIEHSLCEVDKWLRAKNSEGRPRARYVPGRGR